MDCKEIIVDMRDYDPEQAKAGQKTAELLFRLNQTFPRSEEYQKLLKEIFGDNLGENSFIAAPVYGACVETMKIGKNCFINSNLLAMARGGITIGDEQKSELRHAYGKCRIYCFTDSKSNRRRYIPD